ncbi:conjugative transposon protein TraM [Mucilaginibacter sp. RB4R14]|uniref:conjugative transposon protein TraM n=1 Tax=Mucilaginibacter aurantiaciroseus TaxID=2949308 RepID=UPI00209137B0|nr:conjugative transposon protein TraM [Mucilaginibacter aurantiaciroseus]MCO5936463.1 conjugative transposon protein TraM [Mucilaginibacter aurantiaciroseus]
MQTSQSFGIHFTTRPDKARDGKEPIYACVTVNKQRAYIALKHNVDPKNWDSGKGTAKGNKDEVKSINNYLGEVRNTISNNYKQLQLKGKMLSAKAVKDLYLGAEEEVYTLSRLFIYHNETSTTDPQNMADANELKIQTKLAQINRQISQPEAPQYTGGGTHDQQSGPDVKRLEMMMKTMNSGGNDPEMRQLNQMLQQINDIQNPGNENSRIRSQSLKNRQRAYPVMAAKEEDEDDNGVSNDQPSVNYAAYDGGGKSKKHHTANTGQAPGNTIQAVVHQDQTLVSGAVVKLRLVDGIYVNGRMIPKGSFVYGTCGLNNERLIIKIASIRYLNSILPVALSVYDLDGMEGLYVPGSIGRDAAKNGVGDAVQSVQLMSMDQSVGTQAAGVGIEAAKGLFGRKVKQIKVKIKAGYEVLLKDSNERDN